MSHAVFGLKQTKCSPLHLHNIVQAIPATAQLHRVDEQALVAAQVHLMDFNMEGGAASTLCGSPIGFSDDFMVSFSHPYKQGSTLRGLCDIDDFPEGTLSPPPWTLTKSTYFYIRI